MPDQTFWLYRYKEMPYEERTYRHQILNVELEHYNVTVLQTDLFVSSDRNEKEYVRQCVIRYRGFIESYIKSHREFLTSLVPVQEDRFAPQIVAEMIEKSRLVNVGPMASVAGAISQYVGTDMMKRSNNVIIENGGDIYLKTENDAAVGLFAGGSPLTDKLRLKIRKEDMPLGICTSSGTVGPSLSFGKADAVCVKSKSAVLADAAATALGNKVKSMNDIKSALNYGSNIPGVIGIAIVVGSHLGAWGDMELV